MARSAREPAVRLRLSASTDAIVSKTAITFVQGARTLVLSRHEIGPLVELEREIEEAGFDAALAAALAPPQRR